MKGPMVIAIASGSHAIAFAYPSVEKKHTHTQDGVCTVEMRGACVGCPQSTQTLKGMVEKTVRFYVPEARAVALQDFHDLLLQIF